MDITVIKAYIPECNTWKDVVLNAKPNLNFRTIKVPYEFWPGEKKYENVVWFSEIATYFKLCGLELKEAWELTNDLVRLGFLEPLEKVSTESGGEDGIIRFKV